MAAAAARLIQTSWRLRQHSQSVKEQDCASILVGLKFTVVNETATAVEDNWFMDRMLRVN
jgi:hypothetical protein